MARNPYLTVAASFPGCRGAMQGADERQCPMFDCNDADERSWSEEQKKFCCALDGKCQSCALPNSGKEVPHGYKGPGDGTEFCAECECSNGKLSCERVRCGCADQGDFCAELTPEACKTFTVGQDLVGGGFAARELCPVTCKQCEPDVVDPTDCTALVESGATISEEKRASCCAEEKIGCRDCVRVDGGGANDAAAAVYVPDGFIGPGDDFAECQICRCDDGQLSCFGEPCLLASSEEVVCGNTCSSSHGKRRLLAP